MIAPFRGARYLLQGLGLLRVPALRRYVWAPLALNCLVFVLLLTLGGSQVTTLTDGLMAHLPAWLQWLAVLLVPLLWLGLLTIATLLCLLLATVLAAPFTGPLSLAVERHLGHAGPAEHSGAVAMIREGIGGVTRELGKLLHFAVRALPLLLLFWIPGINLVAVALWWVFCAWTLALEYLDIPSGNHGVGFTALRQRLRGGARLAALGFGGTLLALSLIPLVNLILVPAAVAGATAMAIGEGLLPPARR